MKRDLQPGLAGEEDRSKVIFRKPDGHGKVVVPPEARCTGNIWANYLEIAGEVRGDIEVETLVIHPSGHFSGNATYKDITVHDGGSFFARTLDDSAVPRTRETMVPEGKSIDSAGRQFPVIAPVSGED